MSERELREVPPVPHLISARDFRRYELKGSERYKCNSLRGIPTTAPRKGSKDFYNSLHAKKGSAANTAAAEVSHYRTAFVTQLQNQSPEMMASKKPDEDSRSASEMLAKRARLHSCLTRTSRRGAFPGESDKLAE